MIKHVADAAVCLLCSAGMAAVTSGCETRDLSFFY